MNDIEIDNHHFDNLQVWRVIAVFGVFIGHLFQRTAAPDSLIRRLTDHGYLFVELFFLISGFLAIKHFSTHAHSVCKYYKTRAIRILPLYYFIILYFYLTETFVFHDVPPDPSGLRWIRYLVVFIYGNIRSGTGYFDFWTNLGIVWTICVFATFYLFMPLFAKAIRNFYHACIAVFVFWMIHAVMVWKQPPYFYAFSYFVFFMFGVLIWFAYVEKRQKEAYIFFALLLGLNIVLGRTSIAFNDLMMATIAFALLVLSTMDFHYPNARIKNAFQLLDKYSYTIYLAQGIVFCGIIDKMTGVPNVISFVISVVGTFVLSYLLFNYLESPLQKLLQKRFLNPSR